MQLKKVTAYTDGSCLKNPGGPGGWGTVLIYGDVVKDFSGGDASTTNNRMELIAAIQALENLKEPCSVDLYSDSKYVVENIHSISAWRNRGWKTVAKKPVKNQDLWERLDELCRVHSVTFKWVRGHAGNEYNERADRLAHQAAQEAK